LQKTEVKSVSSIIEALRLYDGCEIDVRLTRDRVLVLYHDATYDHRLLLHADFKDLRGVQTLEKLVSHPQVIELINEKDKTLWIDAKKDTAFGLKKDSQFCRTLAKKTSDLLKHSKLRLENVRIISFSTEILKAISHIRTCRIVPYLFSATDLFIPHYNLKTVTQMFTSLKRHIHVTKKMGIGGLLFSKLFLKGFFSLFQPALDEIKSLEEKDFILGTEAQSYKEEKDFKDFVIITDYRGERKDGRGKDAGPLICHRGM
jgi:hypothetical protein